MAVNNKHNNKIGMIMVKKSLLSLAVAVAVTGLTGCNISSTDNNKQKLNGADPLPPGFKPSVTMPQFNPARGSLPLATDILYSSNPKNTDGSAVYAEDADGTFYHSGAYRSIDGGGREQIAVGDVANGYNPVFNALNELDGASINAPMDLPFNAPVDVSSIVVGVNLLVVPINYRTDPADPATEVDPIKAAAAKMTAIPDFANRLLASDVDVESITYPDTKGSALRLKFKTPLMAKKRYAVILGDSIKGTDGKNIKMPSTYNDLLDSSVPLLSTALTALRANIQNSWAPLGKGMLAAAASNIPNSNPGNLVLSYTFSTGGTLDVLSTMAAPGNAKLALESASGTQKPVARPVVIHDTIAAIGGVATNTILGASDTSNAKFMSGTIELPYYLKAPVGAYSDDNLTPQQGYGCDPETAADKAACQQAQLSAAFTITSQWEADDLTALTVPAAPSSNVTRLFPFAKKQGTVAAPVLVVVPENAPATYGHGSGYPVVIFQHGITGNRTNALPFATELAKDGYVTVAIDLPLHGVMPTDTAPSDSTGATPMFGPLLSAADPANAAILGGSDVAAKTALIGGAAAGERHFGLTREAAAFKPTPISATEAKLNGSGSLFINVAHFQTARDNMRQAVMDLMNLNASMANIETESGKDFDLGQTYFVGHSLGAIIGTTFLTVNNANGQANPLNPGRNQSLPAIKGAILGMPGGGITRLLQESPAFGPDLVKGIEGLGVKEDGDLFTKFMYVMQSTLDSVDPIAFAQTLGQIPVPLTLVESIGEKVVPNTVTRSPLAGTEPLATQMGLTKVDTSTTFAITPGDASTMHYWLRFKDDDSSHQSLAKPLQADGTTPDAAFAEIADHAVSLFKAVPAPALSNGTIIESASN